MPPYHAATCQMFRSFIIFLYVSAPMPWLRLPQKGGSWASSRRVGVLVMGHDGITKSPMIFQQVEKKCSKLGTHQDELNDILISIIMQ